MRELLHYLPLPRQWMATLVGALALSTLLWYLGPTLGFGEVRPLGSTDARPIAVVVILLCWLLVTWYMHARETAANKKLIAGAAGGEAAAGEPADAEVKGLRPHLREA